MFSTFILPIATFALTVAFGFLLSTRAKPYNGALFNVHKLLALAAVILTAIQIYNFGTATAIQPSMMLLVALGGLGAVGLFVTGAFMSAEKFDYALIRNIHRIALAIALVALAGIFYFAASMPA